MNGDSNTVSMIFFVMKYTIFQTCLFVCSIGQWWFNWVIHCNDL